MNRLPPLDRLTWERDFMRGVLNKLTNEVIADLLRRGEQPAEDAWPGSGLGGSGVFSIGEVSRPTEAAALARFVEGADGELVEVVPPADPVLDALFELCGALDRAFGLLRRVDRLTMAVRATQDAKGREPVSAPPGDCRACERPITGAVHDKKRGGFCNACRMAWDRLNRAWTEACDVAQAEGRRLPPAPDRARFIAERPKWQQSKTEAS